MSGGPERDQIMQIFNIWLVSIVSGKEPRYIYEKLTWGYFTCKFMYAHNILSLMVYQGIDLLKFPEQVKSELILE